MRFFFILFLAVLKHCNLCVMTCLFVPLSLNNNPDTPQCGAVVTRG